MAVEDNGVIKIILLLIIFNHFDLTLITNLLKASELKEDGSAEEGGMIKVRLMSLIYRTMKLISNLSTWLHWFFSLWPESHRAWSQYLDYFHLTHFKIDLHHFYFDNIDFKLFDLALILITYIFKASDWKQDGLAEEGELIQVRLLNLILK